MTTHEIPLPSGHIALIDEEDWELVKPYKWHASGNNGRSRKIVYVRTTIYRPSGKPIGIQLHRLIMGAAPGVQVDHIDHNALDNRRGNLRICTPGQNNANQRVKRNNSSGYKGVSWHKGTGKWLARTRLAGQEQYLGLFDDPWEAAQAYNAAVQAIWGPFALINERRLTAEEIEIQREVLNLPQIANPLRTNNRSGYKGVCWHKKTGKWVAQINIDGRRKHLGLFDNPWEAAQAYNVAARAIWGDAAYQNERIPELVSA
jgi:hypothetical protein